MNQPIAIVGASTRSAAASAVRAGFQPITADLFADADLRAVATTTRISPYPEGLVDWLRTIVPPAWMYTGALENHPDLVDQMAWIAPLWGNPGDVLERVRSPWELQDLLADFGCYFPETRRSPEGLPRDGSWLVKTYQGASGSGVKILAGEQEAESDERETNIRTPENIARGQLAPTTRSFQERIVGIPCAAVFVGLGGSAMMLGVTRQLIGEDWLGARGFQYAGSIGPWPIHEQTQEDISHVGGIVASHFELLGLFGVDFILKGRNVWPVEVNPRYTASVEVVERFTGIQALTAHKHAFVGSQDVYTIVNSAERSLSLPTCHGKVTMFARRDIMITRHFAEMALHEALVTPWPTLADVSPADTPIAAGRPIITVFAAGENVDEVEQRLRSRVAELEQQIYGGSGP